MRDDFKGAWYPNNLSKNNNSDKKRDTKAVDKDFLKKRLDIDLIKNSGGGSNADREC